jgi:hypothetical protein
MIFPGVLGMMSATFDNHSAVVKSDDLCLVIGSYSQIQADVYRSDHEKGKGEYQPKSLKYEVTGQQ